MAMTIPWAWIGRAATWMIAFFLVLGIKMIIEATIGDEAAYTWNRMLVGMAIGWLLWRGLNRLN